MDGGKGHGSLLGTEGDGGSRLFQLALQLVIGMGTAAEITELLFQKPQGGVAFGKAGEDATS